VLTGPDVLLTLKIAVVTVTLLFLASLVALARGRYRWHGRINTLFFVLTLSALLGLEVMVRFFDPQLFAYFDEVARRNLSIHLCFALPAAVLLPAMLYTGRTHRRILHVALAVAFSAFWSGTFITGIFFLPN
jgi:ABC-type maltose transport system permease subunit